MNIRSVKQLPSPPAILAKVAAVAGDGNSSAADLVRAINLDAGLSSNVLKLANSAFFFRAERVSSVQAAVVKLGLRRVHSLVLASSAAQVLTADERLSGVKVIDFWRHSFTAALAAELIGTHIERWFPVKPGELFCAALLHDIGKPALMSQQPAEMARLVRVMREENKPFCRVEEGALAHAKLGDALAAHWHFPDGLREAIFFHHRPIQCDPAHAVSVMVVHAADCIAHRVGMSTTPGECPPPLSEEVPPSIGMTAGTMDAVAARVLQQERQIEAMLEFLA